MLIRSQEVPTNFTKIVPPRNLMILQNTNLKKAFLSNFQTPVTCHNCHDIHHPGSCTKTTTCQAQEVEYPYHPLFIKYHKSSIENHAFSFKLITFKIQITSEKYLVILGIKKIVCCVIEFNFSIYRWCYLQPKMALV